jgi:hypothetical protein
VGLACALQAYISSQVNTSSYLANFLALPPITLKTKLDVHSNASPQDPHETEQFPPTLAVDTGRIADEGHASQNEARELTHCKREVRFARSAVVLLVVSLLSRRFRRSWNKSLSMFTLGASSGLSFGLLADWLKTLLQLVKEKATRIPGLRVEGDALACKGVDMLVRAPHLTPLTSSPAPKAKPIEQLPEALNDVARRSVELITGHLQNDVNGYGLPWEIAKNSNGIEIFRSKVPGQSRMVWKGRWTVTSEAGLLQIMEEWKDWGKRLKFDLSFGDGAILKTFADGSDIDRCHTKQILTVSPREFLQLRSWRHFSDDSGFLHTMTSVTPQDMVGSPTPARGVVRGDNLPGCGMRWTLLPSDAIDVGGPANTSGRKDWMFEVVIENDPKGWIPTSVINSAMTTQIADTARGTIKHFGGLPMSVDSRVAST